MIDDDMPGWLIARTPEPETLHAWLRHDMADDDGDCMHADGLEPVAKPMEADLSANPVGHNIINHAITLLQMSDEQFSEEWVVKITDLSHGELLRLFYHMRFAGSLKS